MHSNLLSVQDHDDDGDEMHQILVFAMYHYCTTKGWVCICCQVYTTVTHNDNILTHKNAQKLDRIPIVFILSI